MRTLSVGFPLPGPRTQNHDFAKAPSFFDFDALVVDPNSVGQLIDDVIQGGGEHRDRGGLRIVNGATSPDTLLLADLLRDRRDETLRLLARGGLVVCFARPNVGRYDVAGLAGCDRYVWLPGPPGLSYGEPFLRRGAGSEIVVLEQEHPLGGFLHQFRAKLAYDAYFDERAPGFASVRSVIARSAGGAPVAIELTVERGTVILLPPPAKTPAGDERYAFSNALQRAAQGLLGTAATTSPPSWLDAYELPGLREREAARDEARQRVEEARSELAAREAALEEIDRYRRLLWQEGTLGLVGPVRSAFELLGFRIQAEDLDAPAELWPAQTRGRRRDHPGVLLEVDASEEAVGLDGHYRLRRRIEDAIGAGKTRKALLIINGYRTKPPDERPAQYQDALRVAAESMRYCVATTTQLYHAVRAALDGDESTVDAFRDRLLTTEGILHDD